MTLQTSTTRCLAFLYRELAMKSNFLVIMVITIHRLCLGIGEQVLEMSSEQLMRDIFAGEGGGEEGEKNFCFENMSFKKIENNSPHWHGFGNLYLQRSYLA